MLKQPMTTPVAIFSLLVATFFSSVAILFSWQLTNDVAVASAEVVPVYQPNVMPSAATHAKPPRQTVKAVYLTAYSAGSPKKLAEIIDLIDRTELNAVIIDIKDYSGLVLYNSSLKLVSKLKLKDNRYPDLAGTIKKLHDHNIYVIARQTVFQDPVLAQAKPDWAIRDKNGGIWRDRKGLSWVDPSRSEVWRYDMAIAREALQYGFDEINFDYVRFPTDGNLVNAVYHDGTTKKWQVMEKFYTYVNHTLADEPAWISLDLFGLVMEEVGENDMGIGQRLETTVNNVDYIAPMMYPSHYPSGHMGFANPADHPAAIFENGMKKGMPKFANARAEVRPWIQAFNMGAVYDGAKIRAQIDVIEKYTDAGWLLWNAANRYTSAGLKEE